MQTQIKTDPEIANIRQSGRILATVMDELRSAVVPGVSAKQLDKLAAAKTRQMGAKPAFLGFMGFPASLCISFNNEIVHGVPSDRLVKDGDVIGLDYGVDFNGMITDAAVTVGVEKVTAAEQNLLRGTEMALSKAIDTLSDGVRIGDIGYAIEQTFDKAGLKVIHILGGHGVGHEVHEQPMILNYGSRGTGQVLRAGMTVAIEPIASIGTHEAILADDGWTFLTVDGSTAAQFEHTVLITKTGAEILTQS